MSRLIVFIASLSIAFLAISSTCAAGPSKSDSPTVQSSILVSSDDGIASFWPSSEAPSRIVAGGLLSL